MKLIVKNENQEQEKQATFTLKQDGDDINIWVNGMLVAYFEASKAVGDKGKIQLQLMKLPDYEIFKLDSRGYLEVVN